MTEHKHAEVLRAIADGKKVQYTTPTGTEWYDFDPDCMLFSYPMSGMSWRVKPEPKPDVVDERRLYWNKAYRGAIDDAVFNHTPHFAPVADFRLTFDGETGRLKYAVVLE